MGPVSYFTIGIALLTYSSVRQYKREKGEFIRNKLRSWFWWVVTLGCVVLWPVLVASVVCDVICEIWTS
jgi:hypothetical protein